MTYSAMQPWVMLALVMLIAGFAFKIAAVPLPSFVPPVTEWVEALSHPAIMDASKAKADLGWQPRYSGLEALRDTLTAQRP